MSSPETSSDEDHHRLFWAAFEVRRKPGRWSLPRAFRLQRTYHQKFVQVTGLKCSGFNIKGEKQRQTITACHHPLCPTCWHRRQASMLSIIEQLDEPVMYLRSMEGFWYRDTVPKAAMTRFKVKRQREGVNAMRLVCWTVAPYEQRINPKNAEQVAEQKRNLRPATYTSSAPRTGSCFYRLVGVFVADRPVANKYLPKKGRNINRLVDTTAVKVDGVEIAIERRLVAGRDELARRWRELNPHPSRLRLHYFYAEYDGVLKETFPKCYRLEAKSNGLVRPSKKETPFNVDAQGRVSVIVTAREAKRANRKRLRRSKVDTRWVKDMAMPPPAMR